jgi:predicted metal-dependent enzyme (double-stranded beta helix superfamily)
MNRLTVLQRRVPVRAAGAKEAAMHDDGYPLERFVADLRRLAREISDEHRLLADLGPLAQRFAQATLWRSSRHYDPNPEQGFSAHLLHEEPDHALAVFAVSFLPGRGAPPHDHGTWAIVVAVDGCEQNVFWERTDDRSRPGFAQLRRIGVQRLGPGQVAAMPSGTIHSLRNESPQPTLSLHVYGRHVNVTQRSQYDPERNSEAPFLVALDPAH